MQTTPGTPEVVPIRDSWDGPWAWLVYALAVLIAPVVATIFALRAVVMAGLPDWALVAAIGVSAVMLARAAHRAGWNAINGASVAFLTLLIIVGAYGGYHVKTPVVISHNAHLAR